MKQKEVNVKEESLYSEGPEICVLTGMEFTHTVDCETNVKVQSELWEYFQVQLNRLQQYVTKSSLYFPQSNCVF